MTLSRQHRADLKRKRSKLSPAAKSEHRAGPTSIWGRGCPVKVWDGPYSYRCGLGGDAGTCAVHGVFAEAP